MRKKILLAAAANVLLASAIAVAGSGLFGTRALALFEWLLIALALAVVSVLCWAPLLWSLAKQLGLLEEVTARIGGGQLDERVPVANAGALATLSGNVNQMAERFEGIVKDQKRFLSDVAHELNAPLARVQFALGVLEETVGQEQQSDVKALHDEIQEMSALVKELSSFSKAGVEAGSAPLTEVNLLRAAQRAADRENIPIQLNVEAGVTALAHEAYLMRALSNLLRNARRYAGKAGPIEVRAHREDGMVELVVADHGPGVPESELEQIFEPFYRLDRSRTSSTGGKGLGLAIVKSCVAVCRGAVFCRNRAPSGLEVVIRLAPGPKAA